MYEKHEITEEVFSAVDATLGREVPTIGAEMSDTNHRLNERYEVAQELGEDDGTIGEN